MRGICGVGPANLYRIARNHMPSVGARAPASLRRGAPYFIGAGRNRIGVFLVVSPQKPDQPALHLDPVGTENARLVRLVGGLERDRGAAPAQPLQGYLFVVDQRDDEGAVIGGIAALDDDRIAIVDAGIDHAVAGDLQRIMLASPSEQAAGDRDGGALVAQGLDRRAGGDAAVERQVGRGGVGSDWRAGQGGGEIAANDGWRKSAALAAGRSRAFAG